MKFLEFVKRTGALLLVCLLMLPVMPVMGVETQDPDPSITPDNPRIYISWYNENGDPVEVEAQNLGVLPNGEHHFFLQITDPYVIQNKLGDLHARVTQQELEAVFAPDLSYSLNFQDLYPLDQPMPIQKTQPEPARQWFLTLSAAPLPENGYPPNVIIEPVLEPTQEPALEPTQEPALEPTQEPVLEPTQEPVLEPTQEPALEPTQEPALEPTQEPTPEPTQEPVLEPTQEPVPEPTQEPAPPIPTDTPAPVLDTSVASDGVTNGAVNMRSVPSADGGTGTVVVELPANTLLYIEGKLPGSTNPAETWYKVRPEGDAYAQYQNMALYARSDLVRVLTPEEAEAIRNPQQADPTPTPQAAEPVAPPDPTPGAMAKYEGYGVIRTESAPAPLYAAKPTGQDTIVSQLAAGTLVFVWDQEVSLSDGTLWSKVAVQLQSDTTGWVADSAIERVSAAQAQAMIDAMKTPTPAPTEEPDPTPTVRPLEGPIHRYGVVNNPGIKLRVVPPDGTIKESMSKGTIVYVRKAVYHGDQTWYQADMLNSNGKVANYGYVLSEYVTLMTPEEEAAYVATLKNPPTPYPDETETDPPTAAPVLTATPVGVTPSPTPTATPVPTPTPKPTPTPQPYNNYAITVVNNAPLRGNPSNVASILNVLPINEVVFVVRQEYDETGMMWHLVYYGGQYGYMRGDMLRYMTYTEIQNYLAAQVTPSPTPAPQVTVPTVTAGSESGYAELAKGSVNFRKSPSNTGSVIRRLNKGDLVMILGTATGDNYTWYQAEHNGTTGYIRGDMLNILTIAQLNQKVQELQKNSSGSSSGSGSGNGNTTITIPTSNSGLADLSNVDGGWSPNTVPLTSITPMSASPSVSPSPEPTETPDPFGLATDEVELFPSVDPVTTPTQASGPPFLLLGAGIVLLAGGATAYGLVLRNKNIKQQEAAARRRTQQAAGQQRRATTQPVNRTGQAGVTSTIAGGAAAARKDKDGNPISNRRMPPPADGTRRTENDPVAQQRRAQQGGQNPYARPSSQGGETKATPGSQNPYARPSSQGGQAGASGGAQRPASQQPRQGGTAPRSGSTPATGHSDGAPQRQPRTDRRGSTEKPPEDRT